MDDDVLEALINKLQKVREERTPLYLVFEDYDGTEYPISYINIEDERIVFSE